MDPIEFHYKIFSYFEKRGWKALFSPYYIDNYTQKPREIDIIAEKFYKILPPPFIKVNYNDLDLTDQQKYLGTFNVRLYIECKSKALNDYKLLFEKPICRNFSVLQRGINMFFSEMELSYDNLHYFKNNVVKLFKRSKKNKRSKNNDYLYDAINQVLHSMIYFENKFKKDGPNVSLISSEERNHLEILYIVSFPVIIVENINATAIRNKSNFNNEVNNNFVTEGIKNNFVIEVNYCYHDEINKDFRNKIFYIDVVSYENIEEFLKNIESSLEEIKKKLFGEFN
mgnify:CR=1 FL=1